MKKIIPILMISFTLVISGCNTIKGLGQDIEKGGQAIQKSAG